MRKGLLLVLVLGLLAPTPAQADPLDQQIMRAIDSDAVHFAAEATRRGFRRFRRSVTLGPTLSIGPSVDIDGGDSVRTYLAGGLALLHYDIPAIPTSEELRSMAIKTVASAVRAQVDAAADRGEVISEDEQRRLASEAWQRLRDRLLLDMTPRHLEEPKFSVTGEVGHLFDSNAWDVRAQFGLGVGPVFLAVGASLFYERKLMLVIPAEVSVPVLVTDGLNSPVVQLFARGEFPVTGGDDGVRRLVIGARFALDVL